MIDHLVSLRCSRVRVAGFARSAPVAVLPLDHLVDRLPGILDQRVHSIVILHRHGGGSGDVRHRAEGTDEGTERSAERR